MLVLATCTLASCHMLIPQKSITAFDRNLAIVGRYHTTPTAIEFDWAGVSINFRTDAPEVWVQLEGGNSDYNIWVDKKLQQVWRGAPVENQIALTLDGDIHVIEIEKRNDPHYGKAQFQGLYLPQGGKLYPMTNKPKYKIEFIGDSYTVGYGAEGPGIECDGLRQYENVHFSFASLTARAFEAEAHFVAMSGKGVARNYGDSEKVSVLTQTDLYPRVIASQPAPLWDTNAIEQQWQPDAVVIKLGNNDFSTQPHPDSKVFTSRLQALLARVQNQYGAIPIVLVADTAHKGIVENITDAYDTAPPKLKAQLHLVVLDLPKGDAKLPFVGCDWHPNIEGHKLAAAPVIKTLRRILSD